jgi:hypothetical protein
MFPRPEPLFGRRRARLPKRDAMGTPIYAGPPCEVCRRDVDWSNVRETAIRAKLCGTVPYGVCVCGQEAIDAKDSAYRRRWRKAKNEARGRGNSAPVTRGISRKKGDQKP